MIPAIRAQELVLARGTTTILDGIDLELAPGARLGVLGPNGIGKSTLAAALAARGRVAAGSLEILGQDARHSDLRTLRRRIGYLGSHLLRELDASLTAREAVALGAYAGLRAAWFAITDQDRREAEMLLGTVALGDRVKARLTELSSGQLQRVLLARAMMRAPALLVLDEPAAHLDLPGREDMVAAIDALIEGSETTLVVVAHHLEDLPRATTHVLALGRTTTLFGSREEVLTDEVLSAIYARPVRVYEIGGRMVAFGSSSSST